MRHCKKASVFLILLVLIFFPLNSILAQSIIFTRSSQNFPSAQTYQVALGDLDSDGDLDAVCANMGFNNSRIWWNDGDGQFTNSGQTLTQQGHGVALNDLDDDGDLDVFIVCAGYGSNNKPSKIYFNDGTGQLIDSGQNLGDSLLSANHINLADIDTDGDQDAQILYYDGNTQSTYYKFFLNNGSGIFTERILAFPPNYDLSWGDLDADGDMDIFIKHLQGYRVMLNEGNFQFSTVWELSDTLASAEQGHVILEDLDGDADLDAFIINRIPGQSLPAKVFFNDGTGQFFDSGQSLGSFSGWYWLVSGDLDRDGDKDIFISAFQQPNQVWVNDGSGHFTDSGLRLGGNAAHRGTALGDLDADSDLDAFVANFVSGSNEVWFNETVSTKVDEEVIPGQFNLYQNYPNPFNPVTTIDFDIPSTLHTRLEVFSVLGCLVKTLLDEWKSAGSYSIAWDGKDNAGRVVSTGLYYFRLKSGNSCQVQKGVLTK